MKQKTDKKSDRIRMHRFLPVVAFCLTILSLSAQGGLSVLQHPVKQEKIQASSKNTPKKRTQNSVL